MEACSENWKFSTTLRWEACLPGHPEIRKYCLQMSCTPCPSCHERSCLTKEPNVTYRMWYRMQCDVVGQHTISNIDLRHRMFLLRNSIWHYMHIRWCTTVCEPTTSHHLLYWMYRPTTSYTICFPGGIRYRIPWLTPYTILWTKFFNTVSSFYFLCFQIYKNNCIIRIRTIVLVYAIVYDIVKKHCMLYCIQCFQYNVKLLLAAFLDLLWECQRSCTRSTSFYRKMYT